MLATRENPGLLVTIISLFLFFSGPVEANFALVRAIPQGDEAKTERIGRPELLVVRTE